MNFPPEIPEEAKNLRSSLQRLAVAQPRVVAVMFMLMKELR